MKGLQENESIMDVRFVPRDYGDDMVLPDFLFFFFFLNKKHAINKKKKKKKKKKKMRIFILQSMAIAVTGLSKYYYALLSCVYFSSFLQNI